jgi:uncharacterized SAM-binding protein YcdF (DUF218 family)
MEIELVYLLKAVLLPPGANFTGVMLGAFLQKRWPRLAKTLIGFSLALLLVLSLPMGASYLARTVETVPALDLTQFDADSANGWGGDVAQREIAIVVVGAGRYRDAPEYDGDTVSATALMRARYAARLYNETGFPILVSGGSVFEGRASEAMVMGEVLIREFGVRVRWLETRSRNTAGNAEYSAKMLQRENINRVVLVTSAIHMRRTANAFENVGFEVYPAPTAFRQGSSGPGWLVWLPSADALQLSATALHEHLGMLWYLLRY